MQTPYTWSYLYNYESPILFHFQYHRPYTVNKILIVCFNKCKTCTEPIWYVYKYLTENFLKIVLGIWFLWQMYQIRVQIMKENTVVYMYLCILYICICMYVEGFLVKISIICTDDQTVYLRRYYPLFAQLIFSHFSKLYKILNSSK